MIEEDIELEVRGSSYPGQLHRPDETTDQGLLIVPGATHGPYGDVFDELVEAVIDQGLMVARFTLWESQEELSEKGESELRAELSAATNFLKDRGCDDISIVAKSFGGRIVLQYLPNNTDRLVLWAPAVMHGHYDERPSITSQELAAIDLPVLLMQGDSDEVVPVENTKAIADSLQESEFYEVSGEDHSFRARSNEIVARSVSFLPT